MSFGALIDTDRGLGSAYERYYFYRLLDRWADELGAESLLEGPLDGMAGVPGVHGVGMARRGRRVISLVPSEAQAEVTRAIYTQAGGAETTEVRVLPPSDALRRGDEAAWAALPKADLVLAYHTLSFVPDWRVYLARIAGLARKGFIVTVCNPENWGVAIIRGIGRLRGIGGLEPPEYWRTDVLAPALWSLGRVKEHEFFDCPWWPDLQVSPGQSLMDRAKKLVTTKKGRVQFTEGGEDSALAQRFVYGADRWPYFGEGSSWTDELAPALARHPSFERARGKRVKALAGHLHAFLVDTRPRTPRERRRLHMAEAASNEGAHGNEPGA